MSHNTETDDETSDEPSIEDVVEFPDEEEMENGPDETRSWIVLYPEDYDNLMFDEVGNVALLVDEAQAREVKRLAEESIARCSDGGESADD
jgi:hypothetical protein